MFPPLHCRNSLCCEAIKKEKPNKVQCDADEIDIYLQQEASPFLCCQSVASEDGTCTEIVLCFPSPLCCQNPSLCRMADGQCRQEWALVFATLMKTILMDTFCRRGGSCRTTFLLHAFRFLSSTCFTCSVVVGGCIDFSHEKNVARASHQFVHAWRGGFQSFTLLLWH